MFLPILLPIRLKQDVDVEGNINVEKSTPVFAELWDKVMHDAKEN